MIIEEVKPYKCNYLTFDFASENWEKKHYWQLRNDVFVKEQNVFQGTDKDLVDENCIHIIAKCECMGMTDQVVGVVRIHEAEPGVWYGSRLAVREDYRTLSRFNAYNLFVLENANKLFTISVGAALIYKAVSTANYIGCHKFLAQVQPQNEKLFNRLHWQSIKEVEVFGKPHIFMEADLNYYPASIYAKGLERRA